MTDLVRCPGCGQPTVVNGDGVYICLGCNSFGDARGMPRLEGEAWTAGRVKSALRLLRRLVHAVERLTPNAVRLGLEVSWQPKGATVSTQTLPPLTIDTNNNASYSATPVDAAGSQVADTLTWASSDPAVLELTPSADTLSCLAVTKAAGSATVTVSDAAGNSTTQAVSVVSGAAVAINVTETTTPK